MALPKLAEELYALFDSENYEKCQKLLPPIKIELIKHNLLVPMGANTETTEQLNDLKIAERILEIGALLLLLAAEYQAFEHYFASLRPFYGSARLHAQREANTDSTKIISLFLIYLLSQGHISKYHVELELIYSSPLIDVEKDNFLQYPIDLERNLMEGNYIKIWKLLQDDADLPCKEYRHFTSSLRNTLRVEIAHSLEKTGDSIPVSNCKTLLYYPQEQSDLLFEAALREELDVTSWTFKDGFVYFEIGKNNALASDNAAMIKNVLSYAEQIESIV
ncbi:hypothetical protein METBIDRAFT_9807 [Metschnikowia bicuspidata var. bicuspidata NRRL YB-4993]|uniref:PCI domain-containing protein n=1 Tax=Metschnikowia bicuspidata var. bicuspidata NRRL YB-4993 TaxID=869754 RepID=A0A1A0HH96_9ASCO|nr:hypothetical protein METBIDRAFT_9807 [Metschnikowia bicuspidata var. bicuspidata NRRL YB-4993]OBA23554.1 hypothetical protein METBIDRAFT_9807 [Metschnikowia bicuspidata var. bicuspidata NRRL YB-4993]